MFWLGWRRIFVSFSYHALKRLPFLLSLYKADQSRRKTTNAGRIELGAFDYFQEDTAVIFSQHSVLHALNQGLEVAYLMSYERLLRHLACRPATTLQYLLLRSQRVLNQYVSFNGAEELRPLAISLALEWLPLKKTLKLLVNCVFAEIRVHTL